MFVCGNCSVYKPSCLILFKISSFLICVQYWCCHQLVKVRGIKLWSEWNSDVHEYGSRKNEARDANFEHLKVTLTSFFFSFLTVLNWKYTFLPLSDFLLTLWYSLKIHTEDLIDPDVKFETVREIAGFVGANDWTNDELWYSYAYSFILFFDYLCFVMYLLRVSLTSYFVLFI